MAKEHECAKFLGSRAILSLVGVVPSCHRAFVGISWFPRCFLVGISLVQKLFSWVFCGSNSFLVANFVIQRLPVVGCMRKNGRKQKYISAFPSAYSVPNRFQQLSVFFMLERYFIY